MVFFYLKCFFFHVWYLCKIRKNKNKKYGEIRRNKPFYESEKSQSFSFLSDKGFKSAVVNQALLSITAWRFLAYSPFNLTISNKSKFHYVTDK